MGCKLRKWTGRAHFLSHESFITECRHAKLGRRGNWAYTADMNIFRNYTFTWWQVGLLKRPLLSLGIAIDTYCQATFSPWVSFWQQ